MQEHDQDIDKLLEDFEFSAITDGLGFHHSVSEPAKVEKSLSQKANELDQDLKRHIKNLKATKSDSNIHRGDLTPFYSQESVEEKPIEKLEELIAEEDLVETVQAASSELRFFAWTMDVSLVVILSAITTLLSFYSSGIPMNSITLTSEVSLSLFGSMLLLFYLLYFTVLDATEHSTVGKRLCGMRVVKSLKPISLSLSLKRSMFCLISLGLAGLPALLKTQDLFFETQVIKK